MLERTDIGEQVEHRIGFLIDLLFGDPAAVGRPEHDVFMRGQPGKHPASFRYMGNPHTDDFLGTQSGQ